LSDLSVTKKRFTYSPRRTDIAIVVFHKLSETKICGNLQLFSQLSRFVVADRSIWVEACPPLGIPVAIGTKGGGGNIWNVYVINYRPINALSAIIDVQKMK
jgi:hypothetical protein